MDCKEIMIATDKLLQLRERERDREKERERERDLVALL